MLTEKIFAISGGKAKPSKNQTLDGSFQEADFQYEFESAEKIGRRSKCLIDKKEGGHFSWAGNPNLTPWGGQWKVADRCWQNIIAKWRICC